MPTNVPIPKFGQLVTYYGRVSIKKKKNWLTFLEEKKIRCPEKRGERKGERGRGDRNGVEREGERGGERHRYT